MMNERKITVPAAVPVFVYGAGPDLYVIRGSFPSKSESTVLAASQIGLFGSCCAGVNGSSLNIS